MLSYSKKDLCDQPYPPSCQKFAWTRVVPEELQSGCVSSGHIQAPRLEYLRECPSSRVDVTKDNLQTGAEIRSHWRTKKDRQSKGTSDAIITQVNDDETVDLHFLSGANQKKIPRHWVVDVYTKLLEQCLVCRGEGSHKYLPTTKACEAKACPFGLFIHLRRENELSKEWLPKGDPDTTHGYCATCECTGEVITEGHPEFIKDMSRRRLADYGSSAQRHIRRLLTSEASGSA